MLTKLLIIENESDIQSFAYNESGSLIYHLSEDKKASNLEAIYKARINSVNKKSKFAYIDYAPNLQGIVNLKNTNVQSGSDLLCQLVGRVIKINYPNSLRKLSYWVSTLLFYPIRHNIFFLSNLNLHRLQS